MKNVLSEDDIEQIALTHLQALGYEYVLGGDISPEGAAPERQYEEVILRERLQAAIARINPKTNPSAQEEALKKALRCTENEEAHRYLTEGIEVEVRQGAEIRGEKIYLIDYARIENNEFLAVNQFTIIEGRQHKRPDIILFVNGLPLVVIELKNPVAETATLQTAFSQLETYKRAIPSLFVYNALLVISDGYEAMSGSTTSGYGRFMSWKSKDGKTDIEHLQPQMEVLIEGALNRQTLLDLLRHFIVFEHQKEATHKKVAAYHQYYAVNKAVESSLRASAAAGDRRCGVVWHTQGSGKSLSMVFYAGKMIAAPAMQNPTIVVLTDRNDLDEQLYETFSNCQRLLRQQPQQAADRKHLRELLTVASGGIVFTTIQKFMPNWVLEGSASAHIGKSGEALSERKNIVVIADEAHRSQYDFIDGFAKHLRDALPNAAFIGFTGTPIESSDRNTKTVFGEYIDIYDIQQAVRDRATVPIFYESRLAKVNFDEAEKAWLDERVEELLESEENSQRQQAKAKWSRLEAVVGSSARIEKIAEDILQHFEQRSAVLEGKAMIVCMSRRICAELYAAIVRLRPAWHSDEDEKGAIKVIMTGNSSDPLLMQPHIRNKPRRRIIGDRLKSPADPLRIVIVRDMWLTGFDAPCLHTLYIDKPMRGHSLMQAIARVNRVFTEDKAGGLVVDYLGIAQDLKEALGEYVASGGQGAPTLDQEIAVAKTLEIYEAITHQLRFFDWRRFYTLSTGEKMQFLPVIVDYILSQEGGEQSFVENTRSLLKAFAISTPHPRVMAIRDEVALFQALKVRLSKIADHNEGGSSNEEAERAIKQLISSAISADNVVDIFDAAGIRKPNIDILDEQFMEDLRKLPQKNLAVELLKKLLKGEIKKREKFNLVDSRRFSERLAAAINQYHNGMMSTVEFLENVLIPFAAEIRLADQRGENLGLDFREYAFYTALEVSNSAVAILGDEILKHIATELLKTVRSSASIDWAIKESVQASLRRNIRRILRANGYPPELQDQAVETVLAQAKLLAEEINRYDKK